MKLSWEKIFWWAMILFSLFVLYQLIKNILGGSWELEAILVAVLVGNLGISVTNLRELHTLKGEFKHYKNSHQSLGKDFKEFRKETKENFAKIDRKFDGIDRKFDGIGRKFDGIDRKFKKIEQNFSRLSHLMK